MDTDSLSREAYYAIIIEAERLADDLTLHYGLLASACKNEHEYLEKAEKLTKKIIRLKEWELDDFFWCNPPDKKKLIATCKKILENIETVRATPIEKRNFDF